MDEARFQQQPNLCTGWADGGRQAWRATLPLLSPPRPLPHPLPSPTRQVRRRGAPEFGTKVEIKNMNSFSNMQKAIDFEIERQVGRRVHGWTAAPMAQHASK